MNDLATVLAQIQAGLNDPGKREIAQAAQELLMKQVRQSWAERQTEDEFPWPPLKRPSFAGYLKLRHNPNYAFVDFNVLTYKETGEKVYEQDRSDTPTESFLTHKALRAIRYGTVTDNGFETQEIAKYGLWQSDGTTKTGWGPPIPARSFWSFGDDLLDLVAELLATKAAKAVTERSA